MFDYQVEVAIVMFLAVIFLCYCDVSELWRDVHLWVLAGHQVHGAGFTWGGEGGGVLVLVAAPCFLLVYGMYHGDIQYRVSYCS